MIHLTVFIALRTMLVSKRSVGAVEFLKNEMIMTSLDDQQSGRPVL